MLILAELNLDEKVLVKNLCEWDLYFRRIEGYGDIRIPRKGAIRLSRAEIQAQVFDNNVMFVGTDGKGSHARIYIEDKPTRIMLGFEEEDTKEEQNVLTEEKAKKLLSYKTLSAFKKNIEENVQTQSEKMVLIEVAKRMKLNDLDKVEFLEEYTGYKFREPKEK
jgi:hypothetical protein